MTTPFCRLIFIASLLLTFCGAARAEHTGPYVGGFLGGNMLMDSDARDQSGSFNLSFKPALYGSAVVGWDMKAGNSLGEGRLELEYSRRGNRLDNAKFVEGKASGGGNLTADSLLLNCIGLPRDNTSWAPYVLLGIGAARIDASGLKIAGQQLATNTATVFAYQVGTGVDYAMTDSLSLDLGYRFFGTTQPELREPGGLRFKADFFSHSVVLGLRIGF